MPAPIELPPSRAEANPSDLADLSPASDAPDPANRPMGINISTATVTQATAHLPEDQRNLVRWAHHHLKTHFRDWSSASAAIGIDTTTLSRVWKDTYKNPTTGERVPLKNICEKIARYKREAERSGKAVNPEFVRTEIAERIYWLCERAMQNHRMAFLYGDGQVGKTTALVQFAAEHNGGRTCYWDFPPASGVQYMLKRFAKALLVPAKQSFDDMLEDIIAALDPSKLVLIDNVHRVFDCYQKLSIVRCLNTLQYIYDRSGCGMVISATNAFRNQVQQGEFANALKQLNRRGRSYELMLSTEPPKKDLYLIAEWFGLKRPEGRAAEIAEHVAKQDGIGVYRLRLLDAQDYARNKRQDLNWDHFIKAYSITERAAKRTDPGKTEEQEA